jgi:D-tyrosyl-tRNA(Tyr) deacylase
MRAVVQRVNEAAVKLQGGYCSQIDKGLLILAGFEAGDTQNDVEWMSRKIAALRIFSDENGLMNLSVKDIGGDILIVSQFTLYASYQKGNRPSFIQAARPEVAIPIYEMFVEKLSKEIGKKVKTGVFGAAMKVELINDGPVTIVMDSKKPE